MHLSRLKEETLFFMSTKITTVGFAARATWHLAQLHVYVVSFLIRAVKNSRITCKNQEFSKKRATWRQRSDILKIELTYGIAK